MHPFELLFFNIFPLWISCVQFDIFYIAHALVLFSAVLCARCVPSWWATGRDPALSRDFSARNLLRSVTFKNVFHFKGVHVN
jgi:hypothetical protein